MNKGSRELEFEVEEGQWISIVGSDLGEPEKTQIVEMALELAAQDNRADLANRLDYEEAARQFSSAAKLMKRGEMDAIEAPETRGPLEREGDGQVRNSLATDEANVTEDLVGEGVADADNYQRNATRTETRRFR